MLDNRHHNLEAAYPLIIQADALETSKPKQPQALKLVVEHLAS